MKSFGMLALAALTAGVYAEERIVTVCLNPGGNTALLNPGRDAAIRVLNQAGIRVHWHRDERPCRDAANAIVVKVAENTPAHHHPGALAYAMPFEGTRIVLLSDRIVRAATREITPRLLGHVLAHEIVHLLQGLQHHSSDGVMKARWTGRDYSDMMMARLMLSKEDIELMHLGMDRRAQN